eukprot:COSAG01_NODE_4252_length_5206_cov_4.404151_5_plen_110_part_00
MVLDMVLGGSYFARNLRTLKVGGRLAVIGSQGGYTPEAVCFKQLMRRRLTIGGSTLRARGAATKAAIASELRSTVWPLLERGEVGVVLDSVWALHQVPTLRCVLLGGPF